MEENIDNWYDWWGINIQHVKTTYITQNKMKTI